MKFDVEFATFAPKDITAITGLSAAMQRDWRRAGHLPARQHGWATFTLNDVSMIALRKIIADAGLGPAFAKIIFDAPAAAQIVASVNWWALEAQDVHDWLVGADQALVDEVLRFDAHDHFGLIDQVCDFSRPERLRTVQIDPIAGELDLDQLQSDVSAPEEPAITLTLRLDLIGQQVAARTRRSLVKIRGTAST
ncbi:hypothetical protein D3C85_558500 [compost metagenome]